MQEKSYEGVGFVPFARVNFVVGIVGVGVNHGDDDE